MAMIKPEHPDPAFTPALDWGDPLPLLWREVGPGRWRVWPPCQFVMRDPSGPISWWLASRDCYEPNRAITAVAPGTGPRPGESQGFPTGDWGGSVAYPWVRHTDGRSWLYLGEFEVGFQQGRVRFSKSFTEPPFFYPNHANDVPLPDGSQTRAEHHGNPWGTGSRDPNRDWARPTVDHRHSLGTLRIKLTGMTFIDAPGLLPLELPGEAEIERHFRRYEVERACGEVFYLNMMNDLAQSRELMKEIGDDRFSSQMQRFLADHGKDLVRQADGAPVCFASDSSYADIVGTLRRYGEIGEMDTHSWAKRDPTTQERIRAMFARAGYVIREDRF